MSHLFSFLYHKERINQQYDYLHSIKTEYHLLLIRSSSLKLVIILFHNWANLAASFSLLEGIWENDFQINESQFQSYSCISQYISKMKWKKELKNMLPLQTCRKRWPSVLSFLLAQFSLLGLNRHWKRQVVTEIGI